MACRGVHFALTAAQTEAILAIDNDEDLMEFIEEIEEEWDKEWIAESDKAWDAIHRCLSDGTLEYEGGKYPLNQVVLGGRRMYSGEDYIVTFVGLGDVRAAADALVEIDRVWMHNSYFALDPADYDEELCDEDFEYTWEWFENVRQLFNKAAADGRSIIFTADQ